MSERSFHASCEMSTWYESRTLDKNFPALAPFLFSGAEVLDVGCGPGTVTIDVARVIAPGRVSGVDTQPELIDQAVAAAEHAYPARVHFQVADTYALPFADHSFDVTYTRDVFHFLVDPVAALKEQMRVTQPAGTIVAFAVDWGTMVSHPHLPAVQRVLSAWRPYPGAEGAPVFVDVHVGAKLYSYFLAAGMRSVTAKGVYQDDYIIVAGSAEFDAWYPRLQMHFDPRGVGAPMYDFCFEQGFQDSSVVREAQAELERWRACPDAFMAIGYFLVTGNPSE